MTYEEAKALCHVRSAIQREEVRYWKNHPLTFDERVPDAEKFLDDWEEYDPRDEDDNSLDA